MLTMFKVSISLKVSVALEVPVSLEVSVSIAIGKGPFTTAVVIVIATALEFTRETSRLRELMLRRRIEVVAGGWIREVRFDSWGTLVANGFSVRVAEEPGGVVGLLHSVCCGGRGGRGGYLYSPSGAISS